MNHQRARGPNHQGTLTSPTSATSATRQYQEEIWVRQALGEVWVSEQRVGETTRLDTNERSVFTWTESTALMSLTNCHSTVFTGGNQGETGAG